MQRFDVLKDGPFRYIHCTETGALVKTLVQLAGGKFIDETDEILGRPCVGRTLREWKGLLARRPYIAQGKS